MKKQRKFLALFGALVMMMSFSITAFASTLDYSLNIPYPHSGSMQSTELYQKTSSSTPYVNPSKNTISTNYFLSPTRKSAVNATDIVPISSAGQRTFTWKSGYGGLNGYYCLSAYPAVTGAYDDYNVSGTWSN